MTRVGPYASPAAFRRALTDKLKALAKESKWELPQLQRQIAYDRLLERLYMVDDGWIVRGAVALLARDLGVRASKDIDVYREGERTLVEAELRRAAELDVGDWFRFEVGATQAVSDGAAGRRLPISAYIGDTVWASFHVDLVGADIRMTGQPEEVPPIARIAMPAVEQSGYRAYPLVDHVADKVAATFDGYGENKQNPSTRFRDLVDLVGNLARCNYRSGRADDSNAIGGRAARCHSAGPIRRARSRPMGTRLCGRGAAISSADRAYGSMKRSMSCTHFSTHCSTGRRVARWTRNGRRWTA